MTQRRKLEDYMKTIYMLQRRASVRGSDIAAALNVSRPTVSVSLKELAEEGYLERLSDHSVVLTAKGMKIAEEITERNNSIYDMLVSVYTGEPAGIRNITDTANGQPIVATKIMKNGRVVIVKNGQHYNTMGQAIR